MPLFKPLFIHHNEIVMDKDDDLNSFIPSVPSTRFRFLVIAPIFIHHNIIKKVSLSSNRNGLALQGTEYRDDSTSKRFDTHIFRNAHSMSPETPGSVVGELGGKPQLKLLDQEELDIKWNQTKQRLGEAKAGFVESYKRLEDELALAKTGL